jgi:NTE family protein
VHKIALTPDHILASGSLPPGFPMTVIDGVPYWDGGLFDNTPVGALLDLLEEQEIEQLPIFVINLFPTSAAVPQNLMEVQERMMEISYENRFGADLAGPSGDLTAYTTMLEAVERELPPDSPVRAQEPFRRLQRLRALKNLKLIQAGHTPMTGGMDFSAYGVKTRFDKGYAAVDKLFGHQKAA